MTKETPTIDVATRERTGSRHSARLRQAGRLPAVIYGNGDPVHVHVDAKNMTNVLKHGAHVIGVRVDEGESDTCLVRDLQFGWLGDNLIHLDFTRVNMNQMVTVNVPVNLSGDCKAAKAEGAVLDVIRTEIEVSCKVKDIPHEIKADITDMQQVLTIGELDLPEGVTPTLELEKHICHITIVAAAEDAEAADVDADGDEPEVITESKPEADASGAEGGNEG